MSADKNQETLAGRDSTRPLAPWMRLAPAERERLWRGLERLVNAGDTLDEYGALGRGWPSFWPIDLRVLQKQSLAWEGICHDLFLVFRDTLRLLWIGDSNVLEGGELGFLLGIGREFADLARGQLVLLPRGGKVWHASVLGIPGLNRAWEKIKENHPDVFIASAAGIWASWVGSDFTYLPQNEFQVALYHLFRESWRARVCARCRMFFVARKPKQMFCGTGCSAGSRLASKRKWWNRVGAERRTKQRQRISKESSGERKRR